MLLVGVDFEGLAVARGLIGDGLGGEINGNERSGIGLDGCEKLAEERLADDDGEDKVVELVVLVDVGKEAAHDNADAVAGNGPCGMFAAGAGTEILTGNKDGAALIRRVVEHEVGVVGTVGTVTPVEEKVVAEKLLVAGGGLHEAGGDNLVGIDVLQREGYAGGGEGGEGLFH